LCHSVSLYISKILASNQPSFNADVSPFDSPLHKTDWLRVGFIPEIPPSEGACIAQGFAVTAPSFTLHINQWSFLSFVLQSRKPTCFQKVAQLGKPKAIAPDRRFPKQKEPTRWDILIVGFMG
jgi:hypothetical protein